MSTPFLEPGQLPYFPRPDVLEHVSTAFQNGQNVTLFAPRLQGKTWFVVHELLPAASGVWGWRTILIDLWRQRDQPELGVVQGLEKALAKPPSFALKEARANLNAGPVSGGAVWVREGDNAELTLEQRLHAVLGELVKERPVLLALDEFQTMAGAGRESFIAAFRTALQEYRSRLRVIFTGSSRTGLNDLFRKYRAPLFEQAYSLVLPKLGGEFLEDRVEFFRERTGRHLDLGELAEVFDALGYSPGHLNKLLVNLMIQGGTDLRAALDVYSGEIEEMGFSVVWETLKPMDRAVLQLLALKQGVPGIYTDAARLRLADLAGLDRRPTPSTVQAAQKRLAKRGLISPVGEAGQYEVEDHAFAYWVARHTHPVLPAPRIR